MLFNSVKLAKIFSENDAKFQGATLKIVPFGEGPKREYSVDDGIVVQETL
jgi:hypothetical protein